MRVLIAEEALQSGTGHWPNYINGIATGLRTAGDVVDIAMHAEAPEGLQDRLGGFPYFSRNCWMDAASQGACGGIRHNITFEKELRTLLARQEHYDWVCALTMRLQHLLAFANLSRRTGPHAPRHYLLLFVQGFGQYAGLDSPTQFPLSASALLARYCFRRMAPAVRRGKVILAAETAGMRDELERFTGLQAAQLPHPVPACDAPRRPLRAADRLTITCPGFARHEKGTDLLEDAILNLRAVSPATGPHVVLQWPAPFIMPNGVERGPSQRLQEDPHVELANTNLDQRAYCKLLDRTHLIILPYRRKSYHQRVSRVAIEAASRGIPIIYMRGTWSQEIADLAGAGVAIEAETAEAVQAAITTAVEDYAGLSEAAARGAGSVARYHSVETFREGMVERALQ